MKLSSRVPTETQRPAGLKAVAKYEVSTATARDREAIYQLRFEVYARELGQHLANVEGRLRDSLDDCNHYLVVKEAGVITGFVSITPPASKAFSVDKYFARTGLPFVIDDATFEVRLLTVVRERRGSELAMLLMYAALRWVEAGGGRQIIGIGRQEVMDLYQRSGLQPTGQTTRSGRVIYELMHATTTELRSRTERFRGMLERLEERTDWRLPFDFRQPARCFHGGAFFEAIGDDFSALEGRHEIINADVLDAWFPPAPSVLKALNGELAWLLQTSPPTDCRGLVEAIARARGVNPRNILPGAGSSDLIFRALRHWLTPESRVLILDPTYGEYAHVLERVIGCQVDRLELSRENHFAVSPDQLATAIRDEYDLVVLVNPNSPTGQHLSRKQLGPLLEAVPPTTRVWIDETYVDYLGPGESMEGVAAGSENLLVCKSMSKAYALSGARVAYLCAGAHQLESLRAITPPWVVGLPSQVAAVRALAEPDYYRERHRETAQLREQLADGLRDLGWHVLPGVANFLLCELPSAGPGASGVAEACRKRGLFLRDARLMGANLGDRMIRVAVKDAATNRRMLAILRDKTAAGGIKLDSKSPANPW